MNWGAETLWLQLLPLLEAAPSAAGLSIEVLRRATSTNTLLLERVRSGADRQPCLLVAEEQTAGRGRLGRQWLGQAGASLTFSLALPMAPADWSGLSLAVGLALAEALDPWAADAAPRIGLKWPNDLLLLDARNGGGRKLGGILIETVSTGGGGGAARMAVVGVGLNVLPLPELPELAGEAGLSQGHGSLSELLPDISAPAALARVAKPLLQALLRFEGEGFAPLAAAYARRDALRGLPVVTTLAELPEGVAQGVDGQGALLLQRHGVPHRVLSGEVSVRLQRKAGA